MTASPDRTAPSASTRQETADQSATATALVDTGRRPAPGPVDPPSIADTPGTAARRLARLLGRAGAVNPLLYIVIVAIWGSTWLGIKYQLGEVHPAASISYRFGLAALLLAGYAVARRLPMRCSGRAHAWMATVGALMFSTNFVFFYFAEKYLTTGLVAVLFAMALPLSIINAAVFLGRRPSATMVAGTVIGLSGIVAVFWPDLTGFSLDTGSGKGILLALGGTVCFSLGSIATSRVQAAGVPVVQSTVYSMVYGALLLVPVTFATGGYAFDTGPRYVLSLLYLALFGSVIAFAAYLTLLRRIGAGPAAYATVLFPIVALLLSTAFEDFTWTGRALAGVALILGGNALVSAGPQALRRRLNRS